MSIYGPRNIQDLTTLIYCIYRITATVENRPVEKLPTDIIKSSSDKDCLKNARNKLFEEYKIFYQKTQLARRSLYR